LTATLWELVEPVAKGLGLEVVEVEYTFERGSMVLRIYIDRPGGVTVDDCADLSREFSTILDVEDPIPEHYSLEVSSPGIDRPLAKEADFIRFAGHGAKIRTKEAIDGRRNFKVTIEGVEDGCVVVTDSAERRWLLPLDIIDRARLEGEL
jgi:ribosome maturation factor RimP